MLVGKKGNDGLKRHSDSVYASFPEIGREITPEFVTRLADTVSGLFLDGTVDQVDILYTQFVSAMRRNIVQDQLLPVTAIAGEEVGEGEAAAGTGTDFIIEPSAQEIFNVLMPRYLRSRLTAPRSNDLAVENPSSP